MLSVVNNYQEVIKSFQFHHPALSPFLRRTRDESKQWLIDRSLICVSKVALTSGEPRAREFIVYQPSKSMFPLAIESIEAIGPFCVCWRYDVSLSLISKTGFRCSSSPFARPASIWYRKV